MNAFTYEVLCGSWAELGERCRPIRLAVFVTEQAVPLALEWDGLDEAACHVLAVSASGEPIGTGRLLLRDGEAPGGRIGRMAVLSPWRGRGVGRLLLKRLIEEAQRLGCPSVFLHAQVDAIPFYRRFGFEPVGERFEEAAIAHQSMRLDRL